MTRVLKEQLFANKASSIVELETTVPIATQEQASSSKILTKKKYSLCNSCANQQGRYFGILSIGYITR